MQQKELFSTNPGIEISTDYRTYLSKICVNSAYGQIYDYLFYKECETMKRLHECMDRNPAAPQYQSLFPLYHEKVLYDPYTRLPYICMEYIDGITLEDWLCSHSYISTPALLLSKKQMRDLFEQLTAAEYWLSQAGILQFDLNPRNIIITNENPLRIRLIDFTDAYYLDERIRRERPNGYSHKLIDTSAVAWTGNNRKCRNECPSFQLREVELLLFTRLFFKGDYDYCANFESNRHYFYKNYGGLLTSHYESALALRDYEYYEQKRSLGCSVNLFKEWEQWMNSCLMQF